MGKFLISVLGIVQMMALATGCQTAVIHGTETMARRPASGVVGLAAGIEALSNASRLSPTAVTQIIETQVLRNSATIASVLGTSGEAAVLASIIRNLESTDSSLVNALHLRVDLQKQSTANLKAVMRQMIEAAGAGIDVGTVDAMGFGIPSASTFAVVGGNVGSVGMPDLYEVIDFAAFFKGSDPYGKVWEKIRGLRIDVTYLDDGEEKTENGVADVLFNGEHLIARSGGENVNVAAASRADLPFLISTDRYRTIPLDPNKVISFRLKTYAAVLASYAGQKFQEQYQGWSDFKVKKGTDFASLLGKQVAVFDYYSKTIEGVVLKESSTEGILLSTGPNRSWDKSANRIVALKIKP